MSPLRRKLQRFRDRVLFDILTGTGYLLPLLGLRSLHRGLMLRALKRCGLFDRHYYLERHEDVAEDGLLPLRHYVQWGDREGRWPMPLFDPRFYEKEAGLSPALPTNRLLHYACVGRYRGFSPSPWFDVPYYLARNKDVARSGVDPLLHFVRWGGKEGRDPSPRFASAHYLATNPEVAEWGLNPLIHYLEQGQYEGRSPLPLAGEGTFAPRLPQPSSPAIGEWENLAAAGPRHGAAVDVIVPVYTGAAVTLRCIHSVLRTAGQKTPFELIVIDDGSPDRELVVTLAALASKGLFSLLHNERNSGFVYSANRGLSLHPDRDVVLLNSDTEVYGDWLDRLRAAARSQARVGTVTPLSNNATLCSYPNFLHDNPYPLELAYEELDRLIAECNSASAVLTPTGVGFCLYLSRSCIDETGLFDEQAFGRGYGEENDFCQRAIRQGWINLIACDVFVRHWGSASFQGERARRLKEAMQVLKARHPDYHRDIRRFIATDPLQEMRARVDRARLGRLRRERNVLLVTHARGGGTERHVLEDVERLRTAGFGSFLLRPAGKHGGVLITHPDVDLLPNIGVLQLRPHAALLELLRRLSITEVHIHHLIDFCQDAAAAVQQLAAGLGAPIRIMIHDYTAICPRVNLVDKAGIYCGEPAESDCDRCIRRNGSAFGRVEIRRWRGAYAALFRAARTIVVPDPDVAARLSRYFDGVEFEVQPHEIPIAGPFRFRERHLDTDGPIRIVVIGAIGKIKGYDILLACARDARKRHLPLEFLVYGYTMNDVLLRREGVAVTGRYLDAHADEGLEALFPHCIWLPYVWPETYSYTLSIALRLGCPIFAFDLGAIGSRLRALNGAQYLMPLSLASKPDRINDGFLRYRDNLQARNRSADAAERAPAGCDGSPRRDNGPKRPGVGATTEQRPAG